MTKKGAIEAGEFTDIDAITLRLWGYSEDGWLSYLESCGDI
jgi:hypothetical protein